jgi:hypothetical protein
MGWRDQAACQGMDIGIFYPLDSPGHGWGASKARYICRSCPVQAQCLQAGMTELWGIWGGLSPQERRARARALAAGMTPV